MTEQEKRGKAIEEMASILDELDCQNHNVCCRYEDDTLLCNRCCAERLADYILRKKEEVRKEVFDKLIEVSKNFEGVLPIGVLKAWAIEFGVEVEE